MNAVGVCTFALGLVVGRQVHELLCLRHSTNTNILAMPSPEQDRSNAGAVQPSQTNASIPAFLSTTNSALEAFNKKARELDAQGALEQVDDRYTSYVLRPMLFALSTNDYPKAWNVATSLHTTSLRRALVWAIVAAWSKHDPQAVLTAVSLLPENNDQRGWVGQILQTWAEDNPEAAMAQVSQIPIGWRQNSALQSVILGTANRNAWAAADMLKKLPTGMERDMATDIVAQKLAMEDPGSAEVAAALLQQSPNGAMRWASMQVVAAAMAARSIPEAMAWAQTLGSPKDQAIVVGTVASTLLETNKQQAIDLVMTQTDSKLRKEATDVLVQGWASTDIQGAADWVAGLTDSSLRRSALQGLESWWSVREPEAASTFALTTLQEGEERTTALKTAATSWCRIEWSGDEAGQFAMQIPPGPERDAFLAGACEGLQPLDPQQAAQLASAMSPSKAQAEALQNSLGTWAARDPESAAAWGAALPVDSARPVALTTITENWASLDPTACSQWLFSLPPDDAQAKAAQSYVKTVAAIRPDLAAQWVGSIADENQRNQQIENIVQQWLKTDSNAAREWLQQSPLPGERKQQLLGQ